MQKYHSTFKPNLALELILEDNIEVMGDLKDTLLPRRACIIGFISLMTNFDELIPISSLV